MAFDYNKLLEKLLEGVGIRTESLGRIRLGRGVIGKSATIAICTILLFGLVASRLTDHLLLMIIAGAGFVLFVLFFIGSMIYGIKNPGAALLEGAELIMWQKQELDAKGGLPRPGETIAIPDPKSPQRPLLSPPDEPEK